MLKSYTDGKVTAAIRANPGAAIASRLAEHFGGGGHTFASGFKVMGRPLDEVKTDCFKFANDLLNKVDV